MGSLSLPRPLLAALAIVIAFAAVWTVALRPHPQSPTAATNHPAQAPRPATTGESAPTRTARGSMPAAAGKPQAKPAATRHAAGKHAARTHTHHGATPAKVTVLKGNHTAAAVNAALKSGKVLALLLYNPAGSDDRADLGALGHVATHGNSVVKLAAPISMISKLAAVTTNVQVTTSPTLLIVDRRHQATSITGFADPLEYEQAVAAALATGK
jgi:hypothetical protein